MYFNQKKAFINDVLSPHEEEALFQNENNFTWGAKQFYVLANGLKQKNNMENDCFQCYH